MSKWEMVKFSDICYVQGGYAFKSAQFVKNEVPIIRIGNLNGDSVDLDYGVSYPKSFWNDNPAYRVKYGDILIAMSGATVGKIGRYACNEPAVLNQRVGLIRNDENLVFSNYLYRYVKSYMFLNEIKRLSLGCAQPNISAKDIENISIPLPPLDVQQDIANILDAASDLIALRKQQLTELDKLIQSSFHEMFGNPVTNEKGWDMSPLDTFGILKNGMNFSSRDSGVSIHCLGVGDFQNNYRIENTDRLPKISLNKMPAVDYLLQDRDIVFVRSNGNKALVGRCVLVYPGNIPTTFSGFCIRFRPTTKELVETYLIQVLHNTSLKEQLFSNGRGANITNLNQQMLSSMKIPLPPVNLQNQFAEIVTKIEEQKALIQATIDESQTLFDSLMSRYFD